MFYVGVDVPMQRWPFANWVLIGATIFFTVVAWAKGATHLDRDEIAQKLNITDDQEDLTPEQLEKLIKLVKQHYLIGALDPKEFHFRNLITHAFVHGGFLHLLGNMIFLFAFGNAINAKLGHVVYLACYFFFAIFAGLGWMVLGNGVPVVGASGAIMGIAGMFFVLYPFNELAIHSPDTYMWTGDAWRMSSWTFVLIYMGLDLWGTLKQGQGIAYAAHLAGEIGGIALACGLVTVGWVTSDRGEKNLPEAWGWVKEPEAPVRTKKRRPKPPNRPQVDI